MFVTWDVMYMGNVFGAWDEVGLLLTAKKEYQQIGDEYLEKSAEMYQKELYNLIDTQGYRWKKLSDVYLAMKKRKNLDTRTLIATGEYLESIEVGDVDNVNGKRYIYVGVSPNAIHTSGIKMQALAEIHEYGSRDGKIPPRPHYRPAWTKVRPKIKQMWRDAFMEYVSRR